MFAIPVSIDIIIILLVLLIILIIVLMSRIDEIGQETVKLLRKILIEIDETKKDNKED